MGTAANAPIQVRGLRYARHGPPADVLEEAVLNLPAPGVGEALVAMRAAAIHYSDLGMINGTYGRLPDLPAIAGREGVGEVVALGPGTAGPVVGSLVRMPETQGVWREATLAKAEELFPMPAGVPPEQAAMAFINPPTAWCLLHNFVKLQPGGWLVQNAGTSAVGVLVAQWARHLGFRCISVVRDVAAGSRLVELGAAKVAAEDSGYEKNPRALTDGAPIKLALNAIGGESAARLCRAVSSGGVVVTYGGATSELVRFPTRPLIFNDIALRGFWLDRWVRSGPQTEIRAVWDKVFDLMCAGVLVQPIAARYRLADWRTALEHAFRPGKGGKILFTSDWRPSTGRGD